MYPLRFQVQISRIQRQNKFLKSHVFCCWWLVKNYLPVNKSNIQLFSRTLLVLGNRTRDSSAQKIQWNNHKGRGQIILFIYLFIDLFIYLFIYLFIILFSMAFCFFYNSKIRPPFTSTQGASPPHSFLPFSRILKYGHEIHFPTEFSSNPNQTHPSMLIKFFRIFRKPQEVSSIKVEAKVCSAFALHFNIRGTLIYLFMNEKKKD